MTSAPPLAEGAAAPAVASEAPAGGAAGSARPLLSIGEVLADLREDYPDVTISKIRFLESEGLVEPQRTASGYRKFSRGDVQRLRYVLAAQQRHYLPLRVIRDHLDALDRGLEPPPLVDVTPKPPPPAAVPAAEAPPASRPAVRLSRAEVLAGAGISDALLDELEDHGLVRPEGDPGQPAYSVAALDIARMVGEMNRYGIEPRHLRGLRSAAQREAGLIEQAVRPLFRQADDDGDTPAQVATRLAELSARMHTLLLAEALRGSPVTRVG